MFKRSAGVLFPVFSLPGPFGIGTLGKDAHFFIDFLSEMHFSWWQVLPLNPIGDGNSPYTSCSTFAGNYLFIDLTQLYQKGLLTYEEFQQSRQQAKFFIVNYSEVSAVHLKLLRLAFSRLSPKDQFQIDAFSNAHKNWLDPFSSYMALKHNYNNLPWYEWPAKYKNYSVDLCLEVQKEYEIEVTFWKFTQYLFYNQWASLRIYANEHNIHIIGDIPFYVSLDSVDVWSNPSIFDLDEHLHPRNVAGVPPDYFSCDGQLWGNPLFNWELLQNNHYDWWLARVGHALQMYDALRIDHFRGFSAYWSIPADAKSAAVGRWQKGPGLTFFQEVFRCFNRPNIIAEDLGIIDDDVLFLRNSCHFPGMNVFQFAFDGNHENIHLPHCYSDNTVAYTGTHDNNTLLGWLWELPQEVRNQVLQYCGYRGTNWGAGGPKSESCRSIIETIWRSSANLTILPLQDLCGYGCDARINIPGTSDNNWVYRATKTTLDEIDKNYFQLINILFGRV